MTQFTKRAIIEAFVELLETMPFDKISVVEIADRCKINRNTFYYHYPDIYALVDELFKTETEKIIEENNIYDSWQEASLQGILFARMNKKAVYHLYNSVSRDRLERYLYDVTKTSMKCFVHKQAEDLKVSEKDIDALSEFYSAALIGIFINWIREGMKLDLAEYINDMGRLLDGNIRYTLEKCDAGG